MDIICVLITVMLMIGAQYDSTLKYTLSDPLILLYQSRYACFSLKKKILSKAPSNYENCKNKKRMMLNKYFN